MATVKTIKSKHNSYEVKLLKEHNGRKWWTFADVTDLPVKRTQILLAKNSLADVGLDIAYIKTSMKHIVDYAKNGDIDSLKVVTDDFIKRCNFRYNSDILLECAVTTLLLDDEDPELYSINKETEKLNLIKDDSELYDFFLSWAFTLSTQSYLGWHHSEEGLKIAKAKEELMKRHLRNNVKQDK